MYLTAQFFSIILRSQAHVVFPEGSNKQRIIDERSCTTAEDHWTMLLCKAAAYSAIRPKKTYNECVIKEDTELHYCWCSPVGIVHPGTGFLLVMYVLSVMKATAACFINKSTHTKKTFTLLLDDACHLRNATSDILSIVSNRGNRVCK